MISSPPSFGYRNHLFVVYCLLFFVLYRAFVVIASYCGGQRRQQNLSSSLVAPGLFVLYLVWMLFLRLLLLVIMTSGCAASTPTPGGAQNAGSQTIGDGSGHSTSSDDLDEASELAVYDEGASEGSDGSSSPTDADYEGGDEGEDASIDDGFEDTSQEGDVVAQELPPHPFEGLDAAQLKARYLKDPTSLGTIALGRIRGGALINGVQMPEGEAWIVRQPKAAWGTQETIDAISHCINSVHKQFPETPKLYIGHISRKNGGRFPPHVSHQNGRDVDLGYYYSVDEGWYTRAHIKNLDRARTWALVKAFVVDTDVELIIIDRRIQALLREHAESIGEDSHWLDQIFGGKTRTLRPLIRHARGHATHIHVRFYSPIARETGRRIYTTLVKLKRIRPPTFYIRHRVRKGQTLAYLARRYRTSVRAIKRANRIRGTMIREGRVYRIPRKGGVASVEEEGPIVVPPRRLPPSKTSSPTQETIDHRP